MAETYTRTEWKKGDVLTAEKLNNLENAVAIAAQALGISSSQDSSSENLQLNCAGAKIGPVDIGSNITVGGSNSALTTTLYGTLKTNTINGINNDDSVTINNLVVGTAETVNNATVYTGIARFNIDKVEFKKDIELNGKIEVTGSESSIFPAAEIANLTVGSLVSNNGVLTLQSLKIDQSSISSSNPVLFNVGHSTINTQTSSISQYNGEAIFDTAKTTLHGQTVIDSEVSTDLTTLLTVGHTSGSGASTQYHGEAYFNTLQTYFHNINSTGNIATDQGTISAKSIGIGSVNNDAESNQPFQGTAIFQTETAEFYGTTTIHNLIAQTATEDKNGLMSAADKSKIDGAVTDILINNIALPKRIDGKVELDSILNNPSFDELSDGTYVLQMTLTNGRPSYEWVLNSQGE